MKKPIRLIALILSILTLLPATCSYNGYCADMDNLISKCLGGPRVCLTSFRLATAFISHRVTHRSICSTLRTVCISTKIFFQSSSLTIPLYLINYN